jgi:glucose-6-phosphate 1-dehydrogenase
MPIPTTAIILFGATGDLAQNKLLPALYNLMAEGSVKDVLIVAIGRRDYSQEEFHGQVRASFGKKRTISDEEWQRFASSLEYCQMDFAQPDQYVRICEILAKHGSPTQRLLYLSVAPSAYTDILSFIAQNGLHEQMEGGWTRLAIEKPFGTDLASAQELDRHICRFFSEDMLYRIDHYLGKETVQNLLAFRFANGIFEPLWTKEHIDSIQITVAEEEGIKSRAAYYDQTGAFKDLVQNHILQLVALITMEKPESFTFQALSDKKEEVMEGLRFDPSQTVFAQYEGYLHEPGVAQGSDTESYAMTTLYHDCERWQGVPFYLRTGKNLAKRVSEISIQFKATSHTLFCPTDESRQANVLTFRLQPDEGISLQLSVKTPRTTMDVQPVRMEFCYSSMLQKELPDAYERLFADILGGDKTLSLREDTIEKSWIIVDGILAAKVDHELHTYPVGSWGPAMADEIMAKSGRRWLTHENEICNGVIVG